MHLVARARHVVARRPWLYWLVVVALAGGVGLITAGAVAEIDDARRSWGETRPVLVASRTSPRRCTRRPDRACGRVRCRCSPTTPSTARRPDAVARQHVAAGEVLVDADVVSGSAARGADPRRLARRPGRRGRAVGSRCRRSRRGRQRRSGARRRRRGRRPRRQRADRRRAGRTRRRAWRTPRRAASWCCSCCPDDARASERSDHEAVSPDTRRPPGSGPRTPSATR